MMKYYVGQKLYHVTSGGSFKQSIILDITDSEIVLEDIIENEGKVKKIKWFCPFECTKDSLLIDYEEAKTIAEIRRQKWEEERIKFISGQLKY